MVIPSKYYNDFYFFFLDFENKLKQKSLYKFYTIKFDS